jgi:hypothetical protein
MLFALLNHYRSVSFGLLFAVCFDSVCQVFAFRFRCRRDCRAWSTAVSSTLSFSSNGQCKICDPSDRPETPNTKANLHRIWLTRSLGLPFDCTLAEYQSKSLVNFHIDSNSTHCCQLLLTTQLEVRKSRNRRVSQHLDLHYRIRRCF